MYISTNSILTDESGQILVQRRLTMHIQLTYSTVKMHEMMSAKCL